MSFDGEYGIVRWGGTDKESSEVLIPGSRINNTYVYEKQIHGKYPVGQVLEVKGSSQKLEAIPIEADFKTYQELIVQFNQIIQKSSDSRISNLLERTIRQTPIFRKAELLKMVSTKATEY